ncbi:RluA family pseudouridine synthase [Fonticella tunisiensis]|uniref:Pseudouridine synthase n=1 Tax=Fonticella tunisiensis TaxID=1096341 RepID=A0A4R7KS97_9CLOT|nr:RluA family pseudouridine synthase [Fonticella tunisiensis]TDT61828.1 23S rRNA pseudouridine1911/1915/1917 synthase [Fonticella tunisiensis]
MSEKNFKFVVEEEDSGKRIDVYISEKLNDLSRSQVQKLINDEKIKLKNKKVKSNYKIKPGDEISVDIPEPVKLEVVPEDIDIEIMYEDDYIAVVNKPQGMVVHPAAGNNSGTLVNALLARCTSLSSINGVVRPGIVHRIDKDTSGVLVVAKNDEAHRSLSEQIKEHSVKRVYMALTEGIIKNDSGTISAAIGRHPVERKKMAVVTKNGRHAITHYKVLKRYKENTLIEARLETGRTHQIRVHMAYIGHPLVGDPVYGYKKQKYKLKGQALHAAVLGFIHPATKEYMEFTAPLPEYFKELLRKIDR